MLLKRGPDVLLTAPFFSNPSMPRVAVGEIAARPEQADRFLRPIEMDLLHATAVLVGHSHYDHLMDVPYIKKRYLPRAKVYGSDTMKNILTADAVVSPDVVSVEHGAGTATQAGTWWYAAPRVRFMALVSEHAPIIFHLRFSEGTYGQPLQELPMRAFDWRGGQTLAYLIDFLSADGKAVEFRVHYQDAASPPPLGFPPLIDELQDQRRVDVAILCMPGFDQVDNYPEAIVERLKPRFVLGIHWENFFVPLPDDPSDLRTVPTLSAQRFISRLGKVLPKNARFTMPAPGAWMHFGS